jgi:hypothetical protein
MKLKASYIIFLFVLFATVQGSAQMNRNVGRQQYRRSGKPEKRDFMEQSIDYLTKELTLDDFQKAAVKDIMEDEKENITILQTPNNGMSSQEKKDKAKDISDRIYKKIVPLLSPEQAAKYKEIVEKNSN